MLHTTAKYVGTGRRRPIIKTSLSHYMYASVEIEPIAWRSSRLSVVKDAVLKPI